MTVLPGDGLPGDGQSHRQWAVPSRRPLMRMTWHELLFMHWRVDEQSIRRLLPAGLDVDTFDGSAWIGVVPFRMSDVAPRGVPAIPGLSAFPELNVRTYVTRAGERPGVWFFSLDATKWLAVRAARRFFHLPYMDARISMDRGDKAIGYRSKRTHHGESAAQLDVTYSPEGDSFTTRPGSLDHFLTARYCLYCQGGGHLFRGEIDHPPWQIQHARCEVRHNTMVDGLGIELADGPPLAHYSHRIDVIAWSNDCVRDET
jgi:uncharacterized protein YqjF (DUF2071 family)